MSVSDVNVWLILMVWVWTTIWLVGSIFDSLSFWDKWSDARQGVCAVGIAVLLCTVVTSGYIFLSSIEVLP